jgi:alkylhydroperoxidase family enzyme
MIQQLGAVPVPVEVLWNNPKVAEGCLEFSARVRTWEAVGSALTTLVHIAVAAQVGCSWCLDINCFEAQNRDLDLKKAMQVPHWRDSAMFSQLERDVLEYAEAMTNTPPTVSDVLYARLLDHVSAHLKPRKSGQSSST